MSISYFYFFWFVFLFLKYYVPIAKGINSHLSEASSWVTVFQCTHRVSRRWIPAPRQEVFQLLLSTVGVLGHHLFLAPWIVLSFEKEPKHTSTVLRVWWLVVRLDGGERPQEPGELDLHPDPPPARWPHSSREGALWLSRHCPVTRANCMLLFSFLSGSSRRCQFRPSSFQEALPVTPELVQVPHPEFHQNSGLLGITALHRSIYSCLPCTLDQTCFITKSGTCSLLHPGAQHMIGVPEISVEQMLGTGDIWASEIPTKSTFLKREHNKWESLSYMVGKCCF